MSWNEINRRARRLFERYPKTLADNPRLGRAMNIIKHDEVLDKGNGTYVVRSQSEPDLAYTVKKGECECQDHRNGHICKHRIAVALFANL